MRLKGPTVISRGRTGEQDWYVDSIDVVQGSIARLQETLVRSADVLEEARAMRLAGVSLVDLVDGMLAAGGGEARLASYRAFHDFEHAMTVYRAEVIRALVDGERMTFTEIGTLLGVSRQMIARLYGTNSDAVHAPEPELDA
jgi:hypothetical protein